MGYESRLHIIRRIDWGSGNIWGDEIAVFDMGKMGREEATCIDGEKRTFRKVFTRDIDFDLDIDVPDGCDKRTDAYGEWCQWATPEEVYLWLRHSQLTEYYDRAKLLQEYLYALVRMLDEARRFGAKDEIGRKDEICVVHYGL